MDPLIDIDSGYQCANSCSELLLMSSFCCLDPLDLFCLFIGCVILWFMALLTSYSGETYWIFKSF